MKIAYIVSSSYSGSTLLSFLLNAHPEIGTISEFDTMEAIKNDPDYLCSCGDKLRECRFFSSLKSRLNEKGFEFEVDKMDMMLSLSDDERIHRILAEKLPLLQSSLIEHFRDIVIDFIPKYNAIKKQTHKRNEIFMSTILELQGANVFLDATKNPYRIKFLNKHHDVRVIYLLKNGIAGAYSFLKAGRHKKNDMTMHEAASQWFSEQITISRILNDIPINKKIIVSYSELCNDTEEILSRIYRTIGIGQKKFDQFWKAPHHIIGNAMRLTKLREIKERQDWRDKLLPEDIDAYRAVHDKHIHALRSINKEICNHIWY